MSATIRTVLLALLLSAPARAEDAVPEAPPVDRHPDGRIEIMPLVGWVHFDRGIALQDGFLYGLELHHHFRFNNPWVAIGIYAEVSGSQTRFLENEEDRADVIIANAGMTFGIRAHPVVLPVIRAGSGFVLYDATKSGLEVRGRIHYHVGAGLHLFPVKWLALRAEGRVMVHDNLSLGAGSGIRRDVAHGLLQFGVGVAL